MTHALPRVLVKTQEVMAPSLHDLKSVDWDVKRHNKQTNFLWLVSDESGMKPFKADFF